MRQLLCVLVAGILAVVGSRPAGAAEKESTPEERARIVDLSKKYEYDILAPGAKKLATEIVKWWTDVPDLGVNWCANLLADEGVGNKDLAGAVTVQAIAAAGVFVIENAGRASDAQATWVAGLEGVVRAYRNVISRDETRRDPFLDKLSTLQSAGKLGEYVDAHSKTCH